MREIKFRGKRLDNGEWVHGYGIVFADDFCIIDQSNELYVEEEYKFRGDTHFFRLSGVMCDPNSVGQFTGLHDKNGKEIYEGDILIEPGIFDLPRTVFWDHRFMRFGNISPSTCGYIAPHDYRKPEIIGNIHDNPELLKHD